MQLRPVRQDRDDVDGGEHDREAGVLELFLAAFGQRGEAVRQPAAGRGHPSGGRCHVLIVKSAGRLAESAARGSGAVSPQTEARGSSAVFPPPAGGAGEPAVGPMWSDPVPRHDDYMTTESLDARAARAAGPAADVRPPRLAIALIALGAVALELAVSGRYGYVRDELYFLAAGQHLAFGYVDQPSLTPLLARVGSVLGGNTVVGLRVLPALCLAAMIMLTAAMSRRLGAGRTGQVLAALAAATCGEYIGAAHELTTTPAGLPVLDSDSVPGHPAAREPGSALVAGDRGLRRRGQRGQMEHRVPGCCAARGLPGDPGAVDAAQPVPGDRRGARRRARRAGPDLAGGARLAGHPGLPRTAGPGRAQPGHLLAGAGPLHRDRADASLGSRAELGAAQCAGTRVPAAGYCVRTGRGRAVRARRQAVLPGRRIHVPAGSRVRAGLAVAGSPAAGAWPHAAGRL